MPNQSCRQVVEKLGPLHRTGSVATAELRTRRTPIGVLPCVRLARRRLGPDVGQTLPGDAIILVTQSTELQTQREDIARQVEDMLDARPWTPGRLRRTHAGVCSGTDRPALNDRGGDTT